MEFTTTNIKGDIFKNIEKLRTLENWKGVFLSDALSPGEQRQQKDLCCIYVSAKSRGLDVRFRGNVLFIEGKQFTYADIESLPLGLTMESVKLIKVSDGYAFQSHHAFLSNMYMCTIKYDGETYITAEHLFTALMARHHDRQDLLPEILQARDGYDAKRITRKTKIDDTWDGAKIKRMRLVIKLKFDQNDNLRDRLLNLKGYLYEAIKDSTFACGLVLSQLAQISKYYVTTETIFLNLRLTNVALKYLYNFFFFFLIQIFIYPGRLLACASLQSSLQLPYIKSQWFIGSTYS